MADSYHVIVKTPDGSLKHSPKEKESSAKKSADAFVNFKDNPAAIVIHDNKVVYEHPTGTKSDKKFLSAAMAKAYSPSEPPAKKPASKPTEKEIVIESGEDIDRLAQEYDDAMKKKKIVLPETQKKTRPCDIEILESACVAFSMSRCVPPDKAQEIAEKNRDQITILAGKMAQGTITKTEAFQQLIGTMQGNCPMTAIKPQETPSSEPGVNVSAVMRGKKDLVFKKTRFRQDIGNDEDLNDLRHRSLPDGIVIYTTKESDDKVHEILAYAMGYTPSSLINSHTPANLTGYDYRRSIPLMRPSVKVPVWSGFGGRIANPSLTVQRIKESFPDESKVKIEIASGIDLA